MSRVLGRYAKATVAAGIALSNAASIYIATGRLDRVGIAIGVQGLLQGIWVALVPNANGLQNGDVVNIGGTPYRWRNGAWEPQG